MKKFLSVTLILVLLFSLAACSNNSDDNDTRLTEWQETYQTALLQLITKSTIKIDDFKISSAYISDINADGVPTIALSLNPYTVDYPDIILNYVDGKVVKLPIQVDNYGSVTETVSFLNGTNDIVYRSYGNTTGTFSENELQRIYSITDFGKYEIVSEKHFKLSDKLSEKYAEMLVSGGNELDEYQQYILSKMDEEIEKTTGVTPSLIDYKTVAVDFMNSSENSVDMDRVYKYINSMLGIEITEEIISKAENDSSYIDASGTFNGEKYVGNWGNADTVDGGYRVELYIDEADDNKVTCSFNYIRIFDYGPEVVEVNDDGTASFEMRVGPWVYAGQMMFEDEQIKVILDEATAPYPEIKVETIVFEKAVCPDEEESQTIENNETTTSSKMETVTELPKKENTTKKQTTSSACTHKISRFEVIGDEYLGIENRTTVEPDCVNEGYEIYRCPNCMEMAVYRTIEPLGHDFSDKEEFVKYPSAIEEGAYGRRCTREKQNGSLCEEYVQTRTIQKRSGDYSSVDSRFSVSYYTDYKESYHAYNMQVYKMEEPWVRIDDERKWGEVPTIRYNSSEKSVYISYRNQNNELVEVTERYNEEFASRGYYMLYITLQDNGKVDIHYGRLIG